MHNIEDALTTLRTYVINNLGAKLAAITSEKGDAIELPMPDESSIRMRESERLDATETLAIAFIGEESDHVNDFQQGGRDYNHSVRVVVMARHTDEDTLQKMVWRYARALAEIIIADQATMTLGRVTVVKKAVYHKVLKGGDSHTKEVEIPITITRREV